MEVWCKPITASVFRHTKRAEQDTNRITLHTGRNMTDAFQILLRDSMQAFTVKGYRVDDVPDGMTVSGCAQGYETYNDGLAYPDRLTGKTAIAVASNATQGYVFRVKTDMPEGAVPCLYPITVTMQIANADGTETEMPVYLQVYVHKAQIPSPDHSAFGHEYFFRMAGDDETNIAYANAMRELRVNSLYVNAVPLLCKGGTKKIGAHSWHFDFSAFDHFVNLFLTHGSFRMLTITGIIHPVDGKQITAIDEVGKGCSMPIFTEDADMEAASAWAAAFYGSIAAHCKEMGWHTMLQFHLEDEPHTTESWLWARTICKQAAPGVPCTEPIDTLGIGRALGDACDIPVPRLEVFDADREYYTSHRAAERAVWCYSCCYPEEPWWLNKFIDLPARYARMIKWACYAQDISGFLHWGFNFWSEDSLYGLTPNARFKGDGFIVYPNTEMENKGVLMSNRGLATTMGLEEWELLHQLGEKDAALAKTMACRVARTFRAFAEDPAALDDTRREVLFMLDTL